MSLVQRLLKVVRHPDSDLLLMLVGAGGLGVLSYFGWPRSEIVLSVILTVLAALCWSQIRTRHQLASHDALLGHFPAEYFALRKSLKSNYTFIGWTMDRTLPTARGEIAGLLRRGGTVRVVLPDPSNNSLLEMVATSHRNKLPSDQTATKIRQSLQTLVDLDGGGNRVQVRVTNVLPRAGINALDIGKFGGAIMVQYFEHRPDNEAGPILWLTRGRQGEWYDRFADEVERIWQDARPWP